MEGREDMPELRLEGIEKSYRTDPGDLPKSSATFSIKPTNLTIKEGEFFALLGPSGCGKTTLLKLVAGLLTPDKGEIFLDSQRITQMLAEKRGFGMIFQEPLLFPHMTVLENVAFGLKMQGFAKAERLKQAREMLESVGLADFGTRHPLKLSGGQQQRVSLARAIVSKPRLLLMDEPFSALDPGLREDMRSLVGEMHKQYGVTSLFVTHDRDEAFLLADRIGVMKEGRILQAGTPQELYENPANHEVALFLGAKNVIRGELRDGKFTSQGLEVEIPSPNNNRNQPGWLMIRPEILQMAEESTMQNTGNSVSDENVRFLKGIVKQVSFRQGFLHMKIEADSQVLEVIQPAAAGIQPKTGTATKLRYDVRQLRFIPAYQGSEGREKDA
jgi:ABC-type Fe3+/spermidine/putrescine transport system ATPase subunit